jgi:putative holliday junction resolvase
MYAWIVRFLGIDYGRRRIGLALSDATGTLARPWKTIARQGNPSQVAALITALVTDLRTESDGLDGIVVGFPRALSGEATDSTAAVTALVSAMRTRVTLPIVLQDERLSSREAESRLALRIKNWRDRKPLVDAAAAAVILQDYLDTRTVPPSVDSLEDYRP